jgi:hypothetical protein
VTEPYVIAAFLVGPDETLRYLDRMLRLAAGWSNAIVALIDGGGPDELAALEHVGADITIASAAQYMTNESAARNVLLDAIDRHVRTEHVDGPVIVTVLDADEELTTRDGSSLDDAFRGMAATPYRVWPAELLHLWTPAGHMYRTDRTWAPEQKLKVYRWTGDGKRLADKAWACPPVPAEDAPGRICPADESPLRILHWGWARAEDRVAKERLYRLHDGGKYHSGSHIASINDGLHHLAPVPGHAA